MDTKKIIKTLLWIVGILALLRLASLGFTVMTDTTEARYAEIGRLMFESGNYITPILDGAPFWAKPPLSFWATAISYGIFGINDFAARLPHFLFLIGATLIAYFFVRRWRDELRATVTAAVIMTMPVFLYLAGGVMTDPALTFCLTLCMAAFYNTINNYRARFFGLLFFVGIGLGLLAKGPLILVLVGLPTFIFVLWKNRWRDLFRNFPWFSGIPLMLAIALPWYILAERATPGFLQYFIVGEHFERYLTPHWSGDLYGYGRGGFLGKIWLSFIVATVPWSIWFAIKIWSKKFRAAIRPMNEFMFYVAAFAITPMIFFTFSRNIVPAYALLNLIPTAILIAYLMGGKINLNMFKWFAGFCAALLVAVILVQTTVPNWSAVAGFSDKHFIDEYSQYRNTLPLVLYKTQNYSAEFYAGAKGIKYEFAGTAEQSRDRRNAAVLLRLRDLRDLDGIDFTTIAAGKKMILVRVGIH